MGKALILKSIAGAEPMEYRLYFIYVVKLGNNTKSGTTFNKSLEGVELLNQSQTTFIDWIASTESI